MQFRNRATFWKTVLVLPAWKWGVLVLLFLIGALGDLRDEFISSENEEKYKILEFVPSWQWEWWAIAALVVLIAFILESSYRENLRLKPADGPSSSDLEQLAEFQARLLELSNQYISSDALLADWIQDTRQVIDRIDKLLHNEFGRIDQNIFADTSGIMAAQIPNSFNSAHNTMKLHVDRRLKNIRDILSKY